MGKERRIEGIGDKEKPQELKRFPLMSISLAALSNEEHPFKSYADITNKMIDVKKEAKHKKGSSLLLVKV